MSISASGLAALIDHTALKPDTTRDQILLLCREALEHRFAAVCVAPAWLHVAGEGLDGSSVRLASVVGFPNGDTLTAGKASEARFCLAAGAVELDMVIHTGMLKSREHDAVLADITAVVQAARKQPGVVVKVILETALLAREEKIAACRLAEEAGADFVKTSTGFAASGASAEDVALLRQCVGDRLGVKAAGGIRNLATAKAMLAAGATRLGTSASVAILREASARL